jgi:hypothetical protein
MKRNRTVLFQSLYVYTVLYDPSPREAVFLHLYQQIERVCPPTREGRPAAHAAHFDITALRPRWSLAIVLCINESHNHITST